ncbi:MAG: Swt1 family HEPN domain-containing protein [Acidobacteriota bacterium]|nr:Swt1 family HEPN domain-containing protein [Acidobacteriota bacterium]
MGNNDVVGRALHLLKGGLVPFVEKSFPSEPLHDVSHMLKLISFRWNEIEDGLERRARTLSHELIDARNEWAHQVPFSDEDTFRAVDSVERLLKLLGDERHAEEVRVLKKVPGQKIIVETPQEQTALPPKGRLPKVIRIPISGKKREDGSSSVSSIPLRDIPFSTNKSSGNYEPLAKRLNYITSQVYGSMEVKSGRIPRCITPLNFGWIRESRVEPVLEENIEFLRIVMHIGDTKEQGREFFRLNPNGLSWPNHFAGFHTRVRPFIKISDAYASAILWICPTPQESTRTHTLKFFEQFAGRVLSDEWARFDEQISVFIDEWKNKCFVRDSKDQISWEDKIVNTNRNSFLLSVGTEVSVLVPYGTCRELDDTREGSRLSDKYREILEDVKILVEGKFTSRFK